MTELLTWLAGALLIAAGAAIVRARRTNGGRGDLIRVVSSRYLGNKRFLTLVEVEGERLLLGLGGDRISLVARLKDEVAAGLPPRAASARRMLDAEVDAAPRRRAARARGGSPAAAGDFAGAGHDA